MKGDKAKAKEVPDKSDEEDEENLDEFETDGFIVDWDGEEEEEVEEGQKKKRRKRKSMKPFILDDEDLALINENRDLVIYQPQKGSSKLKRLKKFGNDAEGMEPSGFSEDEELLFDTDAEEEKYTSDYEVDDMDNFIVHDEVDMNEIESHIRKRKVNLMKSRRVPREPSSHIVGTADQLLKNKNTIVTSDYFGEGAVSTMEIDIPERMQEFEETEGPYPFDEMNTEEEASWIISQLATNIYPVTFKRTTLDETEGNYYRKKIKREDIVRFLNLHHVEKYDVPFIAMYRKEQCPSLLDETEQDEAVNTTYGDAETAPRLKWHKVLWAIKELDRKWLLLHKRKSSLHMYYNKRYEEEYRNITDETILAFNKQVFQSITHTLKNSESERDIDDAEKKFRLHFPPVEDRMDGKFKRPKTKSEYNNCFKAGLCQLTSKFGYKADQFGSRITMEKAEIEFWEDAEESPEEVASNYMSEIFETPEAVLKGARHMIAVEISSEPSLRKHARCIFMDKAVVSTNPTSEGKSAIDSFHKFAGVERLSEKPLCKFEGAQWLLIQKAEEEKLLEVNIKLPEGVLDKLARDFNGIYLVDGGGRYAWDEQRKLILKDAFSNHLLPSLEKEARESLTTRAKIWIRMEYAKQLWNRVSVAPSQRRDLIAKEKGIQPRVMACCWGPGKPATTFVMLDSSGEILNILHAGSISLRSQNVIDQQRKRNDQQRVLKFITDYLPQVIVIGASNVSCMRLKDDISQIVEDSRVVGQYVDGISVVYGDESLPDIYEHSQISSDQLPGQPGIVKRAVALGRYLQNPLAMVATLCGDQKEIVSWQLCTLDHFLTAHEKYEMIEWVMVDVTNQVGLNINEAVNHGWLLATMQFISGLGPKRVASVKRGLSNSQGLSNRKELTDCGLRTKKVFYNAVGFFRVHCCELPSVCSDIHLLDDTRVHPESYDLAETLAKAVHPHCDQGGMDTDFTPAEAIEYIKDNLQVLKDFDIDAFADNYEKEEGKDRRQTLHDIKNELIHGFLDPRRPWEVPTEDEEFSMMAGKHAHELVEGRVVSAIVRRVLPQRVFCALDSGITGMLSKDDFSDERDDFSLTEKLREGDILTCKIKQIEKSRFQVLLTCKESEMKNSSHQSNLEVDPYYFREQSDSVTQQEKAKKEEVGMKHFKMTRMIDHPRFYNMTSGQAMEFLSGKDAGESIFHPSSRGPFYLSLTLKVCDELYAHKEITEGGKEHKDIASLLQIGTTLKIGDEIFENLDEVIDRYLDPLVMHLKAMITFRKFKKGLKVETDELLKVEKAEYPMRIVYCFCASHEHPGTFILSYIRSTNLRHEYVGLNPKGFKFRKHMFGKIEHLVAHFQKHIDDSQQELAPVRSSERGLIANTWGSENSCHTNSDENRSSAPGSRSKGRDGGGRGRGRGRGRSSFGNGSEEPGNSGAPKWSSGFHDGNGTGGGRGKFSGAQDENLSWSCGSGGATGGGNGNWGSGDTGGGNGNWGSGDKGGGDRNWGGDEEGRNDGAGGLGRGRGRGRGRGPSHEECAYGSAPKWSSSLNSSGGDESWGSKWEGDLKNRGGRSGRGGGNWDEGGGGEQRGGGRFSYRGGRGRNDNDGGNGRGRRGRGGGGGRFSDGGGRGRGRNDGRGRRGGRGRGEDGGGWGASKDGGGWGKKSWDEAQNENTGG